MRAIKLNDDATAGNAATNLGPGREEAGPVIAMIDRQHERGDPTRPQALKSLRSLAPGTKACGSSQEHKSAGKLGTFLTRVLSALIFAGIQAYRRRRVD